MEHFLFSFVKALKPLFCLLGLQATVKMRSLQSQINPKSNYSTNLTVHLIRKNTVTALDHPAYESLGFIVPDIFCICIFLRMI